MNFRTYSTFNIIPTAYCAKPTSQYASTVPIASVPNVASPNATCVVQPTTASGSSTFATTFSLFNGEVGDLTATAVAASLALFNFAETRLPETGAGVAGAVAASVTGSR